MAQQANDRYDWMKVLNQAAGNPEVTYVTQQWRIVVNAQLVYNHSVNTLPRSDIELSFSV